ncbi:MAG: methionyl-tRNA formyltransferase [Lachnospiraceae bacterium]|nr:methionyl-tRNA formyltransferase [Lachnospiraceae bacterium]
MRIVYMGTPDFAVQPLKALYEAGHEILLVVSQPDKPVGRHAELKPTPVKEAALALGLPVMQPLKATNEEFLTELERLAPDVIVVAAYGKILRKRLLDIPKYGCVNIHGSLLPRWRGAAPIQWAVIEGDEKAGLTTMLMGEGLDTGDMLLKEEVVLSADETGGSLFDRLSELGGPLIVRTLEGIEKGTITPVPQDDSLSTYAPMLTKEMGELSFDKTAAEIERLIRGLTPWPGTYTYLKGKLFKIHKAEVSSFVPVGDPGTFCVDEGCLYVKCGDETALKLLEVQIEGKKRMPASDFLKGSAKLLEE